MDHLGNLERNDAMSDSLTEYLSSVDEMMMRTRIGCRFVPHSDWQ